LKHLRESFGYWKKGFIFLLEARAEFPLALKNLNVKALLNGYSAGVDDNFIRAPGT
jgi:hypothetical protein